MNFVNHYNGNKIYVRCLLGDLDGKWVYIEDHYKIRDFVKIRKPLKPIIFDYDIQSDITETSYYNYRLTCFQFDAYEAYKYLVAEGKSDKDALINLFNRKFSEE